DWPGGYCTTVGCGNREDCARGPEAGIDNRCFVSNNPTFCVRMCQAPQDCRSGYLCQPVGQGLGVCFPDPNEPLLDAEAIAASPLGIQCADGDGSGSYALDFQVAQDTSAYMVVPFSEDGQGLRPDRITTPSGQAVDFRGRNAFQAAPSQLFGGLNPTVVPALDTLAGQLEAGGHTYRLTSDARRMCHYLLEEPSAGDEIDLNVYLVNVGVRAAQAPADANINAMLDQFEAVYASAGVGLGEVRFFDVEGALADRFQVIRSQEDVGNVLAITEPPGDTRDAVLSLNVVFIQTFALPGAAGVLGISPGLPGPAGLHGTPNSGVVFTAEFLGQRFRERSGAVVDGNTYTGNVLAHEVGHYLGLFHTTEQNQRTTDPVGDTPDCRGVGDFPFGCPDENNLMFPLAGADNSTVTPGQAAVIRANPLTKE
ncbi:MAG: hypothetical protein KC613_04455, partial [Myxococcales bacterium]|nr:hypothetical protein [Myxococcales bacterium]